LCKGTRNTRVALTEAITPQEEKTILRARNTPVPDRVIDGKGMYVMPGLIDLLRTQLQQGCPRITSTNFIWVTV